MLINSSSPSASPCPPRQPLLVYARCSANRCHHHHHTKQRAMIKCSAVPTIFQCTPTLPGAQEIAATGDDKIEHVFNTFMSL